MRALSFYMLACCAVLGCVTSRSFAAGMFLLAIGIVIGAWWRGLGEVSSSPVIGRDVRVPQSSRVPRAIVRKIDRKPSPASSSSPLRAPVSGVLMRDLPRTPAALERRRLRATPEARARHRKANPEAQAAIVGAAPATCTPVPKAEPMLPMPIASFIV